MVGHTGLLAAALEASTYTMRQCQICHWRSEHECDTCVMVRRHTLAVLSAMFSVALSMALGNLEEDKLYALHYSPICIL